MAEPAAVVPPDFEKQVLEALADITSPMREPGRKRKMPWGKRKASGDGFKTPKGR